VSVLSSGSSGTEDNRREVGTPTRPKKKLKRQSTEKKRGEILLNVNIPVRIRVHRPRNRYRYEKNDGKGTWSQS